MNTRSYTLQRPVSCAPAAYCCAWAGGPPPGPSPTPAAVLWSGGTQRLASAPRRAWPTAIAVCGRPRRFPARPFFAGGRPAGRPAAGRPRRYRLRAAPRAAGPGLRGFGVVGPSGPARRYPPRWTRSPSARSCRAGRPAVALRRGRAAPGRRGSPRRSRRRRSGPGGPARCGGGHGPPGCGVAAPRGRPAPCFCFPAAGSARQVGPGGQKMRKTVQKRTKNRENRRK